MATAKDLFLRKYTLTWGNPERIKPAPDSITLAGETFQRDTSFPGAISDKETLIPSTALSVSSLHLTANLNYKKATKAASSDAFIIEVWNMDETFVNTMKYGNIIVLEAGYETDVDLPAVFIGSIVRVSTHQTGQNRKTKIVCTNDTGAVRGYFSKFEWGAGTNYETMLKEVLSALADQGLPSKAIREGFGSGAISPSTLVTQTGVSYEGNAVQILDKLCQEIDYRAYVVLNEIYIEPKDFPQVRQVIKVKDANIIGRIEKHNDGSKSYQGQPAQVNGIKFKTFLDGRVNTSTKIEIPDGDLKGTYLVKSVSHKLSFEGKDWSTEIIADEVQVE